MLKGGTHGATGPVIICVIKEVGSTAFSATSRQRRSTSTCTEGGGRWGKWGGGKGGGRGREKGTVEGRGGGRDLPQRQAGPAWVWEEVARERRGMARPTAMVSWALVERSGRR